MSTNLLIIGAAILHAWPVWIGAALGLLVVTRRAYMRWVIGG